jgi:3-hydroxyacyl-CoA dehydrogenase
LQFDEGIKFERERFDVLLNGTESKAMRHLFLAERAAAKVAGIGADVAPAKIASVAVIGAGTMGSGIAMSFASAASRSTLFETKQEALDRGLKTIRRNYEGTVAKGRLAHEEAEARIARIAPTLDFAAVKDADLVIEAVFEDMEVKKDLFGRLDALCKPGAVLATNTSRLDVDEIARATQRPASVIGLHFFSPANVMRLVEVVRGAATSPQTIVTSMAVVRAIGKLPVLVGVCDGFVGNRMVAPYAREAEVPAGGRRLPRTSRRCTEEVRPRMGRFAMSDLAGLDISWASRKRLAGARPAHQRYSKVADRLCEMGRFGQKTGAGFYRYESGRPHAPPRSARSGDRRAERAGGRHRAPPHQRRRDRREDDLCAGQRGREDPRRRHCSARLGHRPHLCLRLRLSGVARRPDVLRRHGRP